MLGFGRRRHESRTARRWRRLGERGRALLAALMSLLLTAGLLVAPPGSASAQAERAYPWRSPQLLDPVPTSDAPPSLPAEDVAARLAAQAAKISPPMWPGAGVAEADLTAAMAAARETDRLAPATPEVSVIAGGLPVRVGAAVTPSDAEDRRALAGIGGAPGRVRVESFDRAATARAGQTGLMLRLSRADGTAGAGRVNVAIDYAGVVGAFGGDWAGRLRLGVLAECGLTTPEAPGCQPTPVAHRNDRAARRLVADLTMPGAGGASPAGGASQSASVPSTGQSLIVVAMSGSSSTGGDYTATSLRPSATWSGGGSTGDFTWSYPMRVPPSLGGPAPAVALSYSSQSLDGLTSASNSQPSWVGDGFSYDAGFIERRYKSCTDDGQTGKTDLCWGSDNATLSMSGHGGELIQYSTSPDLWRPVRDDGTRIERIRDTSKNNGDNDGEYWKLTTTDGTQYFYGLNRLSGWTSGKSETGSVFHAPVFGDDPGEPCYQATFANAWCAQAWRWNLDYIVDPHGNTMSYWYGRETNNYARNLTAASVSTYIRAGHLTRVDYGTDNRSGTDTTFTGTAPARVAYTTVDRCALGSGCETHDAAHWPDVPWDRECTSTTSCPGLHSPTFWTTKRLSAVTTQVATATSVWKDVDAWALGVAWLDQGIGDSSKIMWLNTVTQTGRNGTAPDITLPSIMFGPTGTTMHNRVNYGDGNGMFKRFRVAAIYNETGGGMGITYSAPDCVAGSKMPASPESNSYRCFPVYWTPPGGSQILDYWHKYVVTSVTLADLAGGNTTEATAYAYPADAAFWHYDESELTPPGKKTWGQWRGYEQVTVTRGSVVPDQPQLQSVTKYFRGRHGDHLPSGARTQTYTVNGTVYNDDNWLAGNAWQHTVLDGPGGPVVTDTWSEPWASGPTASRTVDGVTTAAYVINTLRTTTKTKLDGGRPDRVAVTTNSFNDGTDGTPRGRLLTVDDQGDVATGADDVCVRHTYARNDAAHIHSLVAEVETDALRCSATPTQGSEVLSLVRTWFDGGGSFPTIPTKGEVTRTQELSVWDANPASRVWVTAARATYDGYGRTRDVFDAVDRKATIGYSPASGAPVTSTTVTNPKLWTTTTLVEPAWGLPTRITDQNSRVTDLSYDALGRATAVWLPGWSKAAHPTVASKAFVYTVRSSGGPSAVATSSLNTAGTGYWTSYELFDGFLRPRQTQHTAATGSGRVITDTYHDTRGLVVKTNAPFYTTGGPSTALLTTSDLAVQSQTRTSYDGVGRPVVSALVSQAVEQWRTTTGYGGDRVDVTPPAGGTGTSTIGDARGQSTELRQYHGTTPTPYTVGSFDQTAYGYDHAGRLTSLVDHVGITWTWGFDQRGLSTSRVDPDKGATASTYDNAGQLLTTTDARGVTLANTYDELGRKTATWKDAVGTGTKLSEWVYDSLLLGRPTSSTRWSAGNAYATAVTGYDAADRPTGTSVTIPAVQTGLAGTYTFGTTYTANGSVATTSLPAAGGLAAETLTATYTSMGLPRKLTGTNQYVSQTTYLQTGQLTSITNNTSTAYQGFDYNPVTKRLVHHNVQAATTPDILKETGYFYDPAGNVTKISDLLEQYGPAYGSDDTQCFGYDYLRRLSQAWTPDSNDCAATASVGGLGGAAPYWLSWTHDTTGNRTSQTNHTAGGDQSTTYQYPAPGSARPHALTSTSGATIGSYSYDNTSNTTSRPGPSGQQTLTWDDEGHLATLTEGAATSSYLYDTGGNRLLTRDPTGTTLHLSLGIEIHVDPAGADPTCTRAYSHAGHIVATRTTADGLSWLFGDHQGTASIAIRHADMTITRRHQTPYGTSRGTTPTWPDQHGYVDGYNDTTSLVHLGAREYDPTAGRFISIDPLMDLADPQQIHGYSYANNNPTTLSDPVGLEPGSWCNTDTCGVLNSQSQTSHPMETGYVNGVARTKSAPKIGAAVYASAYLKENWMGRSLLGKPDTFGPINGLGMAVYADAEALYEWGHSGSGPSYVPNLICVACARAKEQGQLFWVIVVEVTGLKDAYDCYHGSKSACAWLAGGIATGGLGRALRTLKLADNLADGARAACSFSADTKVVMADGSAKPIADIKVGDQVLATNPETGTTTPRTVTHLWVHQDTVVDLDVDGHHLTTTEDHPFWNATDQQWQQAQALDPGDRLLTPDGTTIPVSGLEWSTAHVEAAYNVSVDATHTYYVMAGTTSVLVHNCPSGDTAPFGNGGVHAPKAPSYRSTNAGTYKTRDEAWSATNRDHANNKYSHTREECSPTGCHVHLDIYNNQGQLLETKHYTYQQR